jgi:hypothetical protein
MVVLALMTVLKKKTFHMIIIVIGFHSLKNEVVYKFCLKQDQSYLLHNLDQKAS